LHDFFDQLECVLGAFAQSHECDIGSLAGGYDTHVGDLDLAGDHLVSK
jgi:hypothetical protein